jgi:hypothetical protein
MSQVKGGRTSRVSGDGTPLGRGRGREWRVRPRAAVGREGSGRQSERAILGGVFFFSSGAPVERTLPSAVSRRSNCSVQLSGMLHEHNPTNDEKGLY